MAKQINVEKEIREINQKLSLITSKTEKKLKKANKVLENISKIKIDVVKIIPIKDIDGTSVLSIRLAIPQIDLRFDENGELELNEVYKAMNELGLFSLTDLKKISVAINNLKM